MAEVTDPLAEITYKEVESSHVGRNSNLRILGKHAVVCILGFVGGVFFTTLFQEKVTQPILLEKVISKASSSGKGPVDHLDTHVIDASKPNHQQQVSRLEYPKVFDDPEQQFNYLDTNNDSTLTVADLIDLVGTAYHTSIALPLFSGEELDLEINLADENKDGRVTLEEFKRYAQNQTENEIKTEDEVCTSKTKKCVTATEMKKWNHEAEARAKHEAAQEQSSHAKEEETKRRRLRQHEAAHDAPVPPPYRNDGIISGLWTFGSPATSTPQLRNRLASDGVFPGLRVWSQTRIKSWFWGYYQKQDPVSWITSYGFGGWFTGFVHARHDSLTLKDYDQGSPRFDKSSDDQSWWPYRDFFYWVEGHTQYLEEAQKQTQHPFLVKLAHFSLGCGYTDSELEISKYLKTHTPGWQLAALARPLGHFGSDHFSDTLLLLQEPSTSDCVLVFRGSDDVSDWMANLNVKKGSWCGFDGVHEGFRNELMRAVNAPGYSKRIKPILAKCSSVHVTGHSLGGAQANLFAACIMNPKQPGQDGYHDYKLVSWEKGPAFEVEYSSPPGACYVTEKGRCVTDGIGKHDNNEKCRIKALQKTVLSIKAGDFDTETYYDYFEVKGRRYSGKDGPHGVDVNAGDIMAWSADYSITNGGFTICA